MNNQELTLSELRELWRKAQHYDIIGHERDLFRLYIKNVQQQREIDQLRQQIQENSSGGWRNGYVK